MREIEVSVGDVMRARGASDLHALLDACAGAGLAVSMQQLRLGGGGTPLRSTWRPCMATSFGSLSPRVASAVGQARRRRAR
eukprot:10227020-Alexandrium_andersonii.AAC.1